MSHSRIAPSSAAVWGPPNGCPGSVALQEQYPRVRESGPEAEEGAAAHELGAAMISAEAIGRIGFPGRDFIGTKAPNGVEISVDMYASALLYAEDVARVMRITRVYGGEGLMVEAKVRAPRIHPESYGTVDCALYAKEIRTLYIWDFKNGRRPVEAEGNWQLINYAEAIIDALGLDDQETIVVFRIVRPNTTSGGPVSEWVVQAFELRPYVNHLKRAAEEVFSETPIRRTGSHCKYCSALEFCPEAGGKISNLLEYVGRTRVNEEVDIYAAARRYTIISEALEYLKFMSTALETRLKTALSEGGRVPGWHLKPTKGNRAWALPPDQIVAIGDMLGVELRTEGVVSPAQAEKLGVDKDTVNGFVTRTQGAKLAPVNLKDLRRIFK